MLAVAAARANGGMYTTGVGGRLAASEKKSPVAIVGMAFRLPGDLNDEETLWQALSEGRDMVGRIGAERWAVEELEHPRRSEPGRSVTFSAGVLSRIDEFDAAFFGICLLYTSPSPRDVEESRMPSSA